MRPVEKETIDVTAFIVEATIDCNISIRLNTCDSKDRSKATIHVIIVVPARQLLMKVIRIENMCSDR